MSSERLTKSLVDKLIPADKPYFVWCGKLAGFGVTVRPTGRKTFIVQYWATPQCLDSFRRNLSYSLLLLIGVGCFISQPIDHSGWFAAKGRMRALLVVELHPLSDASLRFWSGFPGMQIDAFVFQGPPQPLDEDVVEEPSLAIHWDADACSAQLVRPGKGRELGALIGVHDLGWTELVDGFVQCIDAKLSFQRVRYPPRQNLACVPVHDSHEIQESAPHRQIGDVSAPNLVGPIHAETAQQIRVNLVALRRLAGIWFLIDRHQAHQPHKAADALFIHEMAFVAQMPGHLPHPIERCLQELLVDQAHQIEVHLAFRPSVYSKMTTARSTAAHTACQLTGLADSAQSSGVSLACPRFELSGQKIVGDGIRHCRSDQWRDMAHSPILACKSLTCSSSISGVFRPPRSKTPDAPSSKARFHWWIIVGWTPNRLASSLTVSSPFSASNATFALNSGWCCFRFDIVDLLRVEDQQTTNRSLRQCPEFRGVAQFRCLRRQWESRRLRLRWPDAYWAWWIRRRCLGRRAKRRTGLREFQRYLWGCGGHFQRGRACKPECSYFNKKSSSTWGEQFAVASVFEFAAGHAVKRAIRFAGWAWT